MNPFDYNKPVLEQKKFAGRGKLLNEVDYWLNLAAGHPPQFKNIAVMGQRGIGKTSLLNAIIKRATSDFKFLGIKIELNNTLAEDPSALFAEIIESLRSVIVNTSRKAAFVDFFRRITFRRSFDLELSILSTKIKSTTGDKQSLPHDELNRGLRAISSTAYKTGYRGIMVCLDEADLLTGNSTIVQILRNSFENQKSYSLVLSGTPRLLNSLGGVFEPIQRFFEPINLGPFESVEEVRDCLTLTLGKNESSMLTDSFVEDVFAISGGHPYLIKLLSFLAYKEAEENQWAHLVLTPELIDRANSDVNQSGFHTESMKLLERKSLPFSPPVNRVRSLKVLKESQFVNTGAAINFTHSLLQELSSSRASALHLQPRTNTVDLFHRIDGRMIRIREFELDGYSALVARLKILASMDSIEKKVPQSGLIQIDQSGEIIQFPIHFMPTDTGESVVIRVAQFTGSLNSIEHSDFISSLAEVLDEFMLSPIGGLVMIASPDMEISKALMTYGMKLMASSEIKVAIIDEETNWGVDGAIHYIPDHQFGLTEAAILKSVPYQDIDLVALSQIYTIDDAENMLRLVNRAHHVLAGISTRNGIETILRLADVGIPPFQISSTLNAIISPRVLRKLCKDCRIKCTEESRDLETLKRFDIDTSFGYWIAPGCDKCGGTGTQGMTSMFEILTITDRIRSALRDGSNNDRYSWNNLNPDQLSIAIESDMGRNNPSLRDQGFELLSKGRVSPAELIKALIC